MKQIRQLKQMIAVVGLTALVSGCDDNKDIILATCKNDNVKIQVVQHQLSGRADHLTVEFYKTDKKGAGDLHFGTMLTPESAYEADFFQFQCDNGRTLKIAENYFSLNQPYFVESKK